MLSAVRIKVSSVLQAVPDEPGNVALHEHRALAARDRAVLAVTLEGTDGLLVQVSRRGFGFGSGGGMGGGVFRMGGVAGGVAGDSAGSAMSGTGLRTRSRSRVSHPAMATSQKLTSR